MRRSPVVFAVAFAVVATVTPASTSAASDPNPGRTATAGAEGLAFGAAGRVTHADRPDVTISRVAAQRLPSPPEDGRVYERRAVDVTFPDDGSVLSTSTVTDKGSATVDGSQLDVIEQARVEGLTMLDGMITADAITATSRTSFGPGGYASRGTVAVANLQINGQVLNDDRVPPNTRIDLPDAGYVVVNQQRRTGDGTTSGGLTLNGLRVHLDDPDGYRGDVRVAHAETMVDR